MGGDRNPNLIIHDSNHCINPPPSFKIFIEQVITGHGYFETSLISRCNSISLYFTGNISIAQDHLQCSFSILEEQPMDMLLGLDMLKRHQVCCGIMYQHEEKRSQFFSSLST